MKYELNNIWWRLFRSEWNKEIPDKYFELAIVRPTYGIYQQSDVWKVGKDNKN